MSRCLLAACLAAAAAGTAVAAAPAASPRVTISVDRTVVATRLGHTFVVRTTIANRAGTPARGLIAHLNVLSLGRGLYVDPEDWSSHRTRYLPPIPGGGATVLTWKLSAVNAGRLGVYVAVLPRNAGPAVPATSPLVRVQIADRRTLDPGGVLPLALGLPAGLALTAALVRLTRRRAPTGDRAS